MGVKSGQVVVQQFPAYNGSSPSNTDQLPVGTLVVNGADANASVGVTNLATGRYQFTVTLPALAVGDGVQVRMSGNISGGSTVVTDTNGYVWSDTCTATAAGNVPADVQAVLGNPATLDAAKRLNVALPAGASADLGTAGAGLTGLPTVKATDAAGNALALASTALSTATWTATRAGNLDNLDAKVSLTATSAALALVATAVANLNNLSALSTLVVPGQLEVPATGSITYPLTLLVKDAEGHLEDLSGVPTLAVANAAGVDRSANLSAVARVSLGRYAATYTVAAGAAQEGLTFAASGTAASDATARLAVASSAVVAIDTGAALSAIQAGVGGIVSGMTVVRANNAAGGAIPSGVAQTGDAYAVVNNATYGNAQLSRPGTAQTIAPGQPVIVPAGGAADLTPVRLGKLDSLTFTTAGRVDATAVAVSDKAGYSAAATNLPTDYAQRTVSPAWYTAPDNADVATALSALVQLIARPDESTTIGQINAATATLAGLVANGAFTRAALANGPATDSAGRVKIDPTDTVAQGFANAVPGQALPQAAADQRDQANVEQGVTAAFAAAGAGPDGKLAVQYQVTQMAAPTYPVVQGSGT